MQVLHWLASGLSDKMLARRAGISDRTARKHRENMLRKSGTHNVCELIGLAILSGWLDPAELAVQESGEKGAGQAPPPPRRNP